MTRKAKSSDPAPTLTESIADNRDRLDAMAAVGEQFASFRPAIEVLTKVRAVPTIFVQVDYATRVGGWPIERISLVHGPSNEGKTAFCMGLGLSFLMRGHFFHHVDAEYATPEPWVRTLMAEHAGHPGFRALRPRTYEETADAVRQSCEVLGNAKAKGRLPADTSMLFVIDSLRKLVPKNLLAKIMKECSDEAPAGKDGRKVKGRGLDGAGGRAAQIKAAMNAQWMDELVPMLAQCGAAMVLVARETDDPDAGMYGEGFKVGGGRAAYYESSIVARIVRQGWVRENGESDSAIYGERHKVEIRKTKVGGKTEKKPVAHFHTSNGALVPAGFDRARDVVTMAIDAGIVDVNGSWVNWEKRKLGQGINAAVKRLDADASLLGDLEAECRTLFKLDDPIVVGG